MSHSGFFNLVGIHIYHTSDRSSDKLSTYQCSFDLSRIDACCLDIDSGNYHDISCANHVSPVVRGCHNRLVDHSVPNHRDAAHTCHHYSSMHSVAICWCRLHNCENIHAYGNRCCHVQSRGLDRCIRIRSCLLNDSIACYCPDVSGTNVSAE
jgi:hypothetical protein